MDPWEGSWSEDDAPRRAVPIVYWNETYQRQETVWLITGVPER